MKIGFLGLGNMGTPMAHNLHAAGYTVTVDDVNDEVVAGFVDANPGATRAEFEDADVIITMLPNSDIVDAVVLDRLLPVVKAGTVFLDMSSSVPKRTQALAVVVGEQGHRLVDAPVSGGVKRAVSGELAIMAGGSADDLASVADILGVLGSAVTHVGDVGAGHAAKALNNLVSASSVSVTVDALHAAEKFGIDPHKMVAVLNGSSGRSNTSENKAEQFMLSGTFASGFPIGLMTKDIRIALDLIESVGLDAPLSRSALAVWDAFCEAGHAGEDHTKVYAIEQ